MSSECLFQSAVASGVSFRAKLVVGASVVKIPQKKQNKNERGLNET